VPNSYRPLHQVDFSFQLIGTEEAKKVISTRPYRFLSMFNTHMPSILLYLKFINVFRLDRHLNSTAWMSPIAIDAAFHSAIPFPSYTLGFFILEDEFLGCQDRDLVAAVAYLEIWKAGGAARIFGDLFFRTQTNLQNSRPKKFDDLFFSNFSHFSTSLRTPPQKPRLQHRPRQRGGRLHHRPPP
jgi:hypothetical protein